MFTAIIVTRTFLRLLVRWAPADERYWFGHGTSPVVPAPAD
jgi:hypothetical protein